MPIDDRIKNLRIHSGPKAEATGDEETAVYSVGELLEWDEKLMKKIKKRLKREIKAWKDDTSALHTQLEEDNDLLEGVLEDNDWPFSGASNVDTGITEIYVNLYKNFLKQSIMASGTIWTTHVEPGNQQLLDMQSAVEDMMNYKAFNEWNVRDAFGDAFLVTPRDGLCMVQWTWAEEYEENVRDIYLITSVEEFDQEFKDSRDLGVDEEKFNEWRSKAETATEEDPLEIPVMFDRLIYQGNMGEAIDLVNYVCFPAHAQGTSARFARGYGKRFTLRKGEIKKKIRKKIWYEEEAKKCLEKKGDYKLSNWNRSRDEIEGLRRGVGAGEEEPEFYELVYRMDTGENDEGERKFLLIYCYERDALVEAMDYPYRVDFYAAFRIDKRPNRQIGKSLIAKIRETHLEINEFHNMRQNSRLIANVPSFKAKNDIKNRADGFDPNAEENQWHPGVIFWLPEMDALEQFKIQPTDLGESMSEEHNAMQLLDLKLGTSSQLMSGQAQKGNKGASGVKTNALINQSLQRLEDPLEEIKKGVEESGDICLSHLYQFGDPAINYSASGETGNTEFKTIHKKFLRTGIKMKMAAVTVADTPDAMLQKGMGIHTLLMKTEPEFMNDSELRVEHLRQTLKEGRVKNVDKFLPPMKVLQQKKMKMMQQAMQQMQQQKQAAMMKQKEDAVKARLGQVKQAMDIKQTARKAAEMAAGNGNGNGNGAGLPQVPEFQEMSAA
jgi:hypothetical protein